MEHRPTLTVFLSAILLSCATTAGTGKPDPYGVRRLVETTAQISPPQSAGERIRLCGIAPGTSTEELSTHACPCTWRDGWICGADDEHTFYAFRDIDGNCIENLSIQTDPMNKEKACEAYSAAVASATRVLGSPFARRDDGCITGIRFNYWAAALWRIERSYVLITVKNDHHAMHDFTVSTDVGAYDVCRSEK